MRVNHRKFRRLRLGPSGEAAMWVCGLLAMAIADPTAPALLETCLLKAAGFQFCPGCGLGHAVAYLARGEILLSFQSHAFAPIVVGVILHRVFVLYREVCFKRNKPAETQIAYVQSNQIPA